MGSLRRADFDALTRALATTTSRRQTLRIVAGVLGGAALGLAGVGCDSNPSPGQPSGGTTSPSSEPPSASDQSSSPDTSSSGTTPSSTGPPGGQGEPCADDPVTVESLAAAGTALAGGATQVDLSPAGCFRYSRTIMNGVVTAEQVTVKGTPVLAWDHTATVSTGIRDSDLDGFDEWTSTITRDATGAVEKVDVVEYDPITHALRSHRTNTITGPNSMQVTIETPSDAGTVSVVYSSPRLQAAAVVTPFGLGAASVAAEAAAGPCGVVGLPCPQGLEQQTLNELRKAAAQGTKCLSKFGLNAEAAGIAANVNGIDIVCTNTSSLGQTPAAYCPDVNPSGRHNIYINLDLWPPAPMSLS
jgi:hypothetical protein